MTTKPYELLARFRADGSIAGVSVRTITTVNGRDYESDPSPLADATDPAFTAFASTFSAAVVAERDALQDQVDSHATEKAALENQIASLQAQLDALQTNTAVVTAVKGRIALRRAGLLETVEQAVTTTNGETQIWWEYAAEWHRNSPVLQALGAAIGLTEQQIDDLFEVAAGIA